MPGNKGLLGNINQFGLNYMVDGKKTPVGSPFRNNIAKYIILEEFC